VHGNVDRACAQRVLDIPREEPPVADARQRNVANAVAGGLERRRLDLHVGPGILQTRRDVRRLPERQPAASRADANGSDVRHRAAVREAAWPE
jgi:hypothetical protein